MVSNIVDQLKRDESYRSKPYRDTVGKETIGYGRNIQDKGITIPEAEKMLLDDIEEAKAKLATVLPWYLALDEVRQAVLINMTFNMGMTGLLGFRRMLALVQLGKYDQAADEMKASKWDLQVGDRAERLEKQMRTGTWQ